MNATARVPSTAERTIKEQVVLVLQGGGALGAYQAGVYQALHEAGLEPEWVSGVSIGAINSALIAGNAPERRLAALCEFWDRITDRTIWPYTPDGDIYRQSRTGSIPGSCRPAPRMPPASMTPRRCTTRCRNWWTSSA